MNEKYSQCNMARMANALPDFLMSACYLVAWCAPYRLGISYLPGLVLIMLMEFVNIHSCSFLCNVVIRDKSLFESQRTIAGLGKNGSILMLVVVYTSFAGALSFIFKTWWTVVTFWLLTFNRMLILLPGRVSDNAAKELVQRGWAAGFVFYILTVVASMAIPLPKLGVTDEVRKAMLLPGHGAWVDQPHTAFAAGFLYFCCVAVSELFDHRWLLKGTIDAQKNGNSKM